MINHLDVPRTIVENLEFRLHLRKWADGNRDRQLELIEACDRDALFFFNAFCWLYEPRDLKSSLNIYNKEKGKGIAEAGGEIPFITWPHQEPIIETIEEQLGLCDIALEKARAEGASWFSVLIILKRWKLRRSRESYGLVSKDELSVDNPNNPDSLMWKLDWELTKLPEWMSQPGSFDRNLSRHTLHNNINGSSIVGYAATSDVASGGRKTAFLMDELAKFPRGDDAKAMASTEPVTESRLIVSTPKGPDGVYYDIMHDADSSAIRLTLDWKDNPTRNRGLYQVINGMPVSIDGQNNPLPIKYRDPEQWQKIKNKLERRGFQLDRTIRSSWFDSRCLRPGMTPKYIAQEYERDYGGSESRFFTLAVVDRLLSESVRPHILFGKLQYEDDGKNPTFIEHFDGYMRIFSSFDLSRMIPYRDDSYVVGCDISTGQGGSGGTNSTASIVRKITGVKVASIATPIVSPELFAVLAVASCYFFADEMGNPAYLIWEDNGPGQQFRNRVIELGFRNFYYRTPMDDIRRKKTRKPGWWSGNRTKRELLGAYGSDLADGKFTNPEEVALVEMKSYYEYPGGVIEHISARKSNDPSGAGENHGDRVIADALANLVLNHLGMRQEKKQKQNPMKAQDAPVGSMRWRMLQEEQRAKQSSKWC